MMRILQILFCAAWLAALQGCLPIVAAGVAGGVAGGAMVAQDRRTGGAYIEDQGIEMKAGDLIDRKHGEVSHVNITSFNRQVLLTGEAPSEAVRADIARIAAGVANVRQVTNEIAIAGISAISARASDAAITSDVKLRFVGSKVFQADHVKVVTEAGVVYLMGLVYHKEAEAAAEIASTTKGARSVVKVFEYLD